MRAFLVMFLGVLTWVGMAAMVLNDHERTQ